MTPKEIIKDRIENFLDYLYDQFLLEDDVRTRYKSYINDYFKNKRMFFKNENVFGVHCGNDHDGCFSPVALFANLKDAEYCLISQVAEANDAGYEYEIAGLNYYRDGSGYLKIIEHEIKSN